MPQRRIERRLYRARGDTCGPHRHTAGRARRRSLSQFPPAAAATRNRQGSFMATKKRTPAKRKPAKPAKKAKASAAPKAIKKTASFVTLFDMKIEIERRGKGKPLVLIPGEEAL